MWSIFNKYYTKRSSQWPKVRAEHIKKEPCCQVCGSSKKPEVHHIVPVNVDPSKELDPDNLITLCDKYCHFIFGHLMNWRSYNETIREDAPRWIKKIKNRP